MPVLPNLWYSESTMKFRRIIVDPECLCLCMHVPETCKDTGSLQSPVQEEDKPV